MSMPGLMPDSISGADSGTGQSGGAAPERQKFRAHLLAVFEELFAHDGFASFSVEMRLLKRGQKEVILHCGRQHRYVLDFQPLTRADGGRP